jgi:rhodanese-related sulfurtransferase
MNRRLTGGMLAMALCVFYSTTVLAEASDPRDSESRYGVLDFLPWDHSWNLYHYRGGRVEKAAALMKEAGVGFVRMDFLWQDIEPKRGVFKFKKYDAIVDALERQGVKVLGVLNYNVHWDSDRWNEPPDAALFVRYAKKVVERYKGRVKYWEIWNEPDSPVYWSPQDGLKGYASLLKQVTPALKEVDPRCKIVLGGLSSTHSIHLKKIYQYAGKDSFDVVNIHPFVNPDLPNAMEILKGIYRGVYKEMQKWGDTEKPIWFTEIGCPGVKDGFSKGWWAGRSQTEDEQARWLSKIYGEPLKWPGVEKIFWAFFRDTPSHFKNGVDYFGLVREDFSRKPAFEAYKKAANTR